MITDWLMVLITFVYVVATILILRANKASVEASKMQLEEMKRQYDEENQPYITTEWIYVKRSFFGLRFTNHGKRIAEQVSIQFNEQFVDSLKEPFKGLVEKQKGKSCVIGVGQHYDIFYGREDILGQHIAPAKGSIYYTSGKKKYKTEFEIDLYNYMTNFAVSSYEEDILKAIREQNTELRRLKEKINQMVIQNQSDDGDSE